VGEYAEVFIGEIRCVVHRDDLSVAGIQCRA